MVTREWLCLESWGQPCLALLTLTLERKTRWGVDKGDPWVSLSESGGDGKAVGQQMGAKAEAWCRLGGIQQPPRFLY